MPKSMTGFGRARSAALSVEIRTVNHKGRDISVKLPSGHYEYEPKLRALVVDALSRGRIDIMVTLREVYRVGTVKANKDLAKDYLNAVRALAKELKMPGEMRMERLVNFPGVIQMGSGHEELVPWNEVETSVRKALKELQAMRMREGKRLATDLGKRLEGLTRLLPRIEQRSQEGLLEYRNRLKARIAALVGDTAATDTPRFEMEVALLAERSDITEEVVRLKSHIEEMKQMLKDVKPVGRRLDFLLQEMNREANTIGSKSNDVQIAHDIVQVKELLEQIREQVQNLE